MSSSSAVEAVFNYASNYFDPENGQPAYWTATQTLELKARSGEMVLDLVGQLQSIGLAIGDLIPVGRPLPTKLKPHGEKPRLRP